jgi:hypothetical protein
MRRRIEVRRVHPADLLRFAARAERAPDRVGPEADGELLPHLAVVVREHVVRVRIEPDHSVHLDPDAGLFLDLAHGRVADPLADVVPAPGEGPQVVVGPVDEKQPAGIVPDDGRD